MNSLHTGLYRSFQNGRTPWNPTTLVFYGWMYADALFKHFPRWPWLLLKFHGVALKFRKIWLPRWHQAWHWSRALWGTVRNGYRERPTLKMTPPNIVQNFSILEEFWRRKQVFSSNWLRILKKSIWGVVKWQGENGTWTPLTKIAAIWVVWDLDTNGFLLLSPQIHRKKYICQSHHKMSI